jgi:hypothetical protein
MFPSYHIASWVVALGLTAMMSGCGSQAPQEKQKAITPAEKSVQATPAGQGEQAGVA